MALQAECNPEGTRRKWSCQHCSPDQSQCRYETVVDPDTSVVHMLEKKKYHVQWGRVYDRLKTLRIQASSSKHYHILSLLLKLSFPQALHPTQYPTNRANTIMIQGYVLFNTSVEVNNDFIFFIL